MQAHYYDNEPHLNQRNDQARRSQIEDMVDFALSKKMRSVEDENAPMVFAGDFNLPARAQPENDTIESDDYTNMMLTFNTSFKSTKKKS